MLFSIKSSLTWCNGKKFTKSYLKIKKLSDTAYTITESICIEKEDIIG